jgi:peptide/nickel transport system ATP-binding protein
MVNVTIEALGVAYRDGDDAIQALDHVSLKLMPGRILALVGESGSGKTTLGKALMGLLPGNAEARGSIKLGQQEILGLDEAALNRFRWSRVAMVFQNGAGSLNPVHRVIDQIAEPLIYSGSMNPSEARREAEAHLPALGLTSEQGVRFPHELSGGQIQRALMAMALIMDPDVLILDEPTAALDAMTKSFMAEIIRQERHRNKAILLITHDLAFVRTLADEVAVLYLGQIVERMPGRDLLTHPLHPYTLGLGRSYPTMEANRDLGGIRGDAFYRLIHVHAKEKGGNHLHAHVAFPGSHHSGDHTRQEGCLFQARCTQAIEACSRGAVSLVTVEDHEVRCLRGGIVQILELRQVSKCYGHVTALHPTDLRIRAGEAFCIVGETGSGKTTLAMMTAGLLNPDQGHRLFDDRDMDEWIASDYPSLARRIGVIYQNPAESVSHRFTVFDVVAEPLRIQGSGGDKKEMEGRVLRTLSDVHLSTDPKFLKRYPHELNMGAIQRLCLARALVVNPTLLVADEPTSALDPSVQAKVLKLLFDLQIEKGLTVLFVTHNIGLARKIADRIGVMLAGRLLEVGPASLLLSHPLHPYTRLLIESTRGDEKPMGTGAETVTNAGCPFVPRCGRAGEICFHEFPYLSAAHETNRTVRCHFPLGSVPPSLQEKRPEVAPNFNRGTG